MKILSMQTGAEFSERRVWRYLLWRKWSESLPMLNIIGLNPSTADETTDDATSRRCIGFARDWGFGGLYLTNLFAFRAKRPIDLREADAPIGPDNDSWLIETANRSGLIVVAWGENGVYRNRDKSVCHLLAAFDLQCFRITPKTRTPQHPLYLPGNLTPIPYNFTSRSHFHA